MGPACHPQPMLEPAQLRLLTAAKTALAVVIALGIAMALNWELPYWSGITVMIVSLPYVGAAFEKSLLRIGGTILAGIAAYLLTGAFEQDQVAMSLSLFALLAALGYGAMGTRAPYFFLLSGITICIIVGQTIPDPGRLWHLVQYRVMEVCLGIVVALSVNSLLWPQRASLALRYKVVDLLEECRDLFLLGRAHYQRGEPLPDDLPARERAVAARFPQLATLLQAALRDGSRFLHHREAAKEMFGESRQCFVAAVTALRAAADDYPKAFQRLVTTELDATTEALHRDFDQLIEDLRADRPPRKLTASREARAVLETKLQAIREAGTSFEYPTEDVSNFFAYVGDLDSLREALIRLAQAARTLYRDAEAHHLPSPVKSAQPRWHLDIRRAQHGIKVGVASLIALYTYLWLQWPSGVTAFVTCAIVIQVSITASNQKSLLRLGGCLLGGVCGAFTLAVVEPAVSTYWAYAVPLYAIFFLFAWINAGPQKYAYAGFQAHLAFLLMTTISAEQSVNLKAGFDRFMGILLGVFIAAVVQRLIWPVLPEREFRRDLGLFFERARNFLHTQDERLRAQQGDAVERDQERDLVQIDYLPADTLQWLEQIGFRDRELAGKDALTQTYLHVQAIAFALRGMAQANARLVHPELLAALRPELIALDHALADALGRCAMAFRDLCCFEPDDRLRQAELAFEERLRRLTRVERATRQLKGQELGGFLALARRYRELSALIKACEKQTAGLNFGVLQRSDFF